ncbi:putative transposase [Trichonephila clavipes]|nr:putative transposase [Trichonephila clavipes]
MNSQVLIQTWTQRNGSMCKSSASLRRQCFVKGPGFSGGLRHFQKEESQLKMNLTAEGPNFQKPLKMSLESGIFELFLGQYEHSCCSSAPYPPDLSPCDFFLFPKLKNHLKGDHFGTLENIQTAVTDQLKAIPIYEFHQCYEKWQKRLQRCVASEGSYFEGDNVEFARYSFLSARMSYARYDRDSQRRRNGYAARCPSIPPTLNGPNKITQNTNVSQTDGRDPLRGHALHAFVGGGGLIAYGSFIKIGP